MSGTVTIPIEEYESLWDDRDMLRALEAAGVDNWSGYDLAQDIYNEEREREDGE